MGYQLNQEVKLTEVCQALGFELHGIDILIKSVAPIRTAVAGDVSFSTKEVQDASGMALIIGNNCDAKRSKDNGYIFHDNPRLAFIQVLNYLVDNIGFSTYEFESEIHSTASIGENVVIESGCVIEADVLIEHNVVIHSGTRIGQGSRIRSCSSIGGDGFGFEKQEGDLPLRFPHLAGVVIGENVEIGALNSIARGTLGDTVIGDGVKTDNLVHIAHNCHIGSKVLITACAEISGGVCIEDDVWIGPNSSFMQKVSIGQGAFVGLGAVVTKDVAPNVVVAGNPARKIREL